MIDGERLPSVTNILQKTKSLEDKEALERWKKENKDSEIMEMMKRLTAIKRKVEKRLKGRPQV